jgi:hypothetical protein
LSGETRGETPLICPTRQAEYFLQRGLTRGVRKRAIDLPVGQSGRKDIVVEFRSERMIVDEVIFHQPNGTLRCVAESKAPGGRASAFALRATEGSSSSDVQGSNKFSGVA